MNDHKMVICEEVVRVKYMYIVKHNESKLLRAKGLTVPSLAIVAIRIC